MMVYRLQLERVGVRRTETKSKAAGHVQRTEAHCGGITRETVGCL